MYRETCKSTHANFWLHSRFQVPLLCAAQMRNVGSRKCAVYFDDPSRDYFFSGEDFYDDVTMMYGLVLNIRHASLLAAGMLN